MIFGINGIVDWALRISNYCMFIFQIINSQLNLISLFLAAFQIFITYKITL